MSVFDILRKYRQAHGPETMDNLSDEEKSAIRTIQIEEAGSGTLARIIKKDGTESTMGLYFQDHDIPAGTILDLDKCVIVFKDAGIGGVVKSLHYVGMDFVPNWVVTFSKPLSEVYNVDSIRDIKIIATEYGLSALLSFRDGTTKRISINRDSREDLHVGDIINPADCTIIKMRRFHTRRFNSLLVK